jgi:hypothetical protein
MNPPESQQVGSSKSPWWGWGLVAASFLLVLLLNAGAIAWADREVTEGYVARPYMGVCLPVSAVLLGIGALAGREEAKARGGSPWKGALLGIWIGAVPLILLSLILLFLWGYYAMYFLM